MEKLSSVLLCAINNTSDSSLLGRWGYYVQEILVDHYKQHVRKKLYTEKETEDYDQDPMPKVHSLGINYIIPTHNELKQIFPQQNSIWLLPLYWWNILQDHDSLKETEWYLQILQIF